MLTITLRDATTGEALLATGDRRLIDAVLAALAARLAEAGAHFGATLPPDDGGEGESGEEVPEPRGGSR